LGSSPPAPQAGPGDGRVRSSQPKGGRYRTKVEVLRDFLLATREESRKTRIIGTANLNPASFQKYLASCIRLNLVQKSAHGYELTARAEVVLDRIERLLEMSSEVESALVGLNRFLGEGSGAGEVSPTLRFVSRLAWNPGRRPTEDHGTPLPNSISPDRSGGYPASGLAFDWDPGVESTKGMPPRADRSAREATQDERRVAARPYSRSSSRR